MINTLTSAQKEFKKVIKEEYINRLAVATIDEKMLVEAIEFIYKKLNKPFPRVLIASDPVLAVKQLKKSCPTLTAFQYFGVGYDSGWIAFYDYFIRIGAIKNNENFKAYTKLIKCGAFAYIFLDKTAVAISNPLFIKRNTKQQMHCSNGPCIKWKGGFEMYRLNGVQMTKEQIMTPAEHLDVLAVVNEKNIEVRRELIRKIGIERFLQKAGAKILDKRGDYEVLSIRLSDEVPDARYLKMLNPSIGVWHVEGVDTECNTVEKALNWRAGNIREPWNPTTLT